MLVLSRKVGERLLIGDKIVVTLVRIGAESVRIGIDAPGDMNIAREELLIRSIEDEYLRQSAFENHYAEMTGDVAPSEKE